MDRYHPAVVFRLGLLSTRTVFRCLASAGEIEFAPACQHAPSIPSKLECIRLKTVFRLCKMHG